MYIFVSISNMKVVNNNTYSATLSYYFLSTSETKASSVVCTILTADRKEQRTSHHSIGTLACLC